MFRILILENCIFSLKMRYFWLSGPNGSPDKKLKHKENVAHRMFMGGCIIDLVWKNDSLYLIIAMFSYKWVTLYFSLFSLHSWQTAYQVSLGQIVVWQSPISSPSLSPLRHHCDLLFTQDSQSLSEWNVCQICRDAEFPQLYNVLSQRFVLFLACSVGK